MLIRALFALLACGPWLQAQEAWMPPPAPEQEATKASNGIYFLEAGFSRNDGKAGQPQSAWNVGLDTQHKNRWADDLVATLNARVDLDGARGEGVSTHSGSLTLREAYLAWHPVDAWILDAGRMQVRDGVALGFNPTDVFRRDSLLAWRTQDFNRLRESRLGVVSLLTQYLEDGRGVALALAPKLSRPLNDPLWYDPHLANTNAASRWYMKVMPGSLRSAYGNLILSGSEDGSRLAGLNLTSGFGQSTVAYLEAAQAKRSLEDGGNGRWSGQAATGCTYTTSWRQSFTVEYRFNGMQAKDIGGQAFDPGAWMEAQRWQEPASRESVLLHMNWDRFLSDFVTLQAFWQRDLHENTSLVWGEWAYRRMHAGISLNVSHQSGNPHTAFGFARQIWAANIVARYYF